MNSDKVSSYVPQIYDTCMETLQLTRAEDNILDLAELFSDAASKNQFILTADAEGIEQRERTLGISADPTTEDLDFRRARLFNRYSMTPPFTYYFFIRKLNEIVGEGQWKVSLDYATRSLYIETLAIDRNWYEELTFTINYLKPCNLVFFNVPILPSTLSTGEEVSYREYVWNYRMSRWKVGDKAFSDKEYKGVIKVPETNSIQPRFLNNVTSFLSTEIVGARINNTVIITTFRTREITDNVLTLEYDITPAMTSIITKVQLLGVNNVVLTEATVYVPVIQTVINKHTLRVKEG